MRAAVQAANASCRARLLPWPPSGYAAFLGAEPRHLLAPGRIEPDG